MNMKIRAGSGSMTIFLSLVLMLILSLLLTLAEGIHYIGLQADTRLNSRTAVENVMAEYNRELWNRYEILGLDMGYGVKDSNPGEVERRMLTSAQMNAAQNLYEMDVSGCALASYRLLTDDGCAGFIREAADAQMKSMGKNLAEEAISRYQDSKQNSTDLDVEKMLETGEKAMKQKDQDTGKDAENETDLEVPAEITVGEPPQEQQEAPTENPIDQIVSFRQRTVLGQVIPAEEELSTNSCGDMEPMEKRSIPSGSISDKLEIRESERILFRLYLLDHFDCYSQDASDAADGSEQKMLSYEIEYLLCGKDSDTANLEALVVRLLAMREAENLAALIMDASKMAELESLAWSIAGISASPLIVKAVKAGLAAAWAYLESVLDVRLLLTGGKVPLVKNAAQWTSSIAELPSYLDTHVTAKDTGQGIDYRSYQMTFLMLSKPQKLALRAMDLMEGTIRLEEGYENTRMDHMLCEMRSHFAYEAEPLFLKWITVGDLPNDGYSWQRDEDVSYL